MSPEIAQLVAILDQAYDKPSWHGTNLRGSLRRVSSAQAAWRPSRSRHNIWELAVHAAYWKYAVTRRFTGAARGSFPLKGSNWFRRDGGTDGEWRSDLALLDEMHRTLRTAVIGLPPSQLGKSPAGSKVSNFAVISGAAAHDLYHAGQIQLLKRLSRVYKARPGLRT